jgi:hypothetical protein
VRFSVLVFLSGSLSLSRGGEVVAGDRNR